MQGGFVANLRLVIFVSQVGSGLCPYPTGSVVSGSPWAWRADCVCVPVLAGVTLAQARLGDLSCRGVAPMPRELAFPVPKGKKWHDLYDYIRYGCSHPWEGQDGQCHLRNDRSI